MAMFAAIRRASSGIILEIDVSKPLAVVVAHDEAGVNVLDRPRRREAAFGIAGLA
jgi:hypothetical protein